MGVLNPHPHPAYLPPPTPPYTPPPHTHPRYLQGRGGATSCDVYFSVNTMAFRCDVQRLKCQELMTFC